MKKVDAYHNYSWSTTLTDVIDALIELCVDGLITDGAHHKQWYLEQILEGLGVNIDDLRDDIGWEKGMIP